MNEKNITTSEKQNIKKFSPSIIPSLEHLATVSIVNTLYRQQDISDIIKIESKHEILKKTEQLLVKKFLLLPLPELIKKYSQAFNICKVLALQGCLAIDLERKFEESRELEQCICGFEFLIPPEYFDCISFKMDGSVDMLKTFTLMHQRNYLAHKIFIAAAHLCSKELASKSWAKLPSELFLCPDKREQLGIDITHCILMKYWINLMTSQSPNLLLNVEMQLHHSGQRIINLGPICIFRSIFRFLSRYVNLHAAKYFFEILTNKGFSFDIESEIEFSFDLFIICNIEEFKFSKVQVEALDMIFFLLSNLSKRERQIEILRKHIASLITSLISNLSYQKFIEPVMQFIWSSLDADDFLRIFKQILKLILNKNFTAIKIFRQMIKESDSELRKSFLDYYVASLRADSFDCDLFDVHFFNIFKMIMFECTDDVKTYYLCSLANVPKLCSLIRDLSYIKIIDASLDQILSSNSEMIKFRKFVVKECFEPLLFHWIHEDKYESIEKFLEWGSTSIDEIDIRYKKKFKFSTRDLDYLAFVTRDTMVTRVLNWFSSSDKEISGFKKLFAYESRFRFKNWGLFLKFVDWCFDCKQDVENYKKFLSKYENLQAEMWRIAENNFEYVDNLLNWCLSPECVHLFKFKHFSIEIYNTTHAIISKKKDAERLQYNYPSLREMGTYLGEWYCRNCKLGPMGKILLGDALNYNKRELEKGNSGKPLPFSPSLGWVDMEMEMEFFESLVFTLESHHTFSLADFLLMGF